MFAGNRSGLDNDERIIDVLKNGAGEVGSKRMKKLTLLKGLDDQLLQYICNDDKKVRRERITLPEAILTLYPSSGDAIKRDGRGTRV